MHFNVYDVIYSRYSICYLNLIYIDYLYIMDLMNSRKVELIRKETKFLCLCRVLDF